MTRLLDKLSRQVQTSFARYINSRFCTNPWSTKPKNMDFDECLDKSKTQLVDIFNAGVKAVQPGSIIENCVSVVGEEMRIRDMTYKINNNVYLVGFGKAVMGMAAKMEKKLGSHLKRGIVSVPRGSIENIYHCSEKNTHEYCFPNFNGPVEYRESSKDNQPDEDTLTTSHDIVDLVESLGEKDILVVLVSGGGSALLYMPRPSIGSESKLRLCKKLQNSGAGIKELNAVRKKLSMVKGGGLALMAHPARVVTLVLSDIVGDPIDLVASGPTIYGEKSPEEVASILEKYKLWGEVDGDLKNLLTLKESRANEKPLLNAKKEFTHVDNFIIGNNTIAMNAASVEARRKGLNPVVLRNDVVGNVRDVSEAYADLTSLVCRAWNRDIEINAFYEAMKSNKILSLPGKKVDEIFDSLEGSNDSGVVLIAGGEPEVVVRGSGRGGRNQELALSFSLDFLARVKKYPQLANYDVTFLSAGTDGQDGPTDATGAFGYPAIEPTVNFLRRKLKKISNERIVLEGSGFVQSYENSEIASKLRVAESIVPRNALANNDSYNFYSRFRKGKDLLKTGITGTNVMDLHILLVKKRQCGCNLEFEREKNCPDTLDEHDLREDDEERKLRLGRREYEIDNPERKLLDLKIADSSLTERCCQRKSD